LRSLRTKALAFVKLAFIFGGLNLIQFVVGNYLNRGLRAASFSAPPFLFPLAVFFWTFLWGIAGAFIGAPIVSRF
jgi:AI-2 transport protein TqsA